MLDNQSARGDDVSVYSETASVFNGWHSGFPPPPHYADLDF